MTEGAKRVGAAALLLSASVLLSRVLGYVREAVLAAAVGIGPATDAYKAAFQIPDVLNYFLAGGALSIPFIPLYSRYLERADEEGAARALGTVFGTTMALVSVATAFLFWQADAFVALFFHDFSPELQAQTVRLTRIILPGQIFFFAGGILRAALMARGNFAAHALAPVLYNVCIILGGLLLAPRMGVEGFSWGCLAGAIVGPFLVPVVDARRRRLRLAPRVQPLSADFKQYARLLAPLCLGATLLTVDEWFDRYFGHQIGVGAIAVITFARTLMLVPIAAVGQAVATAALPAFSRLHAAGKPRELNSLLQRTLEISLGLAIWLAAGLWALADPAVRLLYERGAFTSADSAAVAPVLALLCFGVAGWVVQQISVRAFYAREQMWAPMLLGTAIAALAVPLYWWLGAERGVEGLAMAGAIAVSVNAVATLVLGRVRHGAPDLGELLQTALRVGAVAGIGAVVAVRFVEGRPGFLGALLDAAAGGAVFLALTLPGIAWVAPKLRHALVARLRRSPAP